MPRRIQRVWVVLAIFLPCLHRFATGGFAFTSSKIPQRADRARLTLPLRAGKDDIIVRLPDEGIPEGVRKLRPGPEGPPSGPAEVDKVDVGCLPTSSELSDRLRSEYMLGTNQILPLRGILGGSAYSKTLRKQVRQNGKNNGSVLIFGEQGTKKDMLAFLIHYSRAKGSLYFVDCGGVSVKGARIFGRARSSGLLDLASEGTVVFNDVDKLNKALLPRVLQLAVNGTYWSKAQHKEKQSKLKVILTAEQWSSVLQLLPKNKVVQIKVPALRVRRSDISSMVQYELRRLTRGTGRPIPEIEPEALKRLQAYDFPNNVEELFFLIDNAYRNMEPGGSITSDLLWTAQSVQKLDLFKVNLLEVYPGLRRFLQSDWLERLNHGFTKYAFPVFVILLFIGPQTFSQNFGLNLFWAWWWPGILLTYPILGRFWCAVCPFMIYGEVVQRWRVGQGAVLQKWPTKQLEAYGPWFLYFLFLAILLWEELWVLENTAYLSSWLLLLITFGAMVGSWFYERRVWCRYLCPIGGMNGLYALLALTELRSQQGECKASCDTFHCYKGGPAEGEGQETNGCPLYSHPASLKDNKNCVLCFTCLRACPHRTVQVNLRAPGIDFGFPFLFPIPGTSSARQHESSAPELALLFLLLGAVFCHHLQDLVVQAGAPDTLLDDFTVHSALAAAALLGPGIFVWMMDRLARGLSALFYPEQKVLNDFLDLGYAYLPLTWLASLAHYLKLGLVDAGQVLPTAARTASFFVAGLAEWAPWAPGTSFAQEQLKFLEEALPHGSAPPDVVAFLQGVVLLLAATFALLKLGKLGGRAPFAWIHQAVILLLTYELWQLIL